MEGLESINRRDIILSKETHIRALDKFSEEYGISWEEIKTKPKTKR